MKKNKQTSLKQFLNDSIPAPAAVSVYGGAGNKNAGGGPGNSGPGDKNSQNEKGHGGQPTG